MAPYGSLAQLKEQQALHLMGLRRQLQRELDGAYAAPGDISSLTGMRRLYLAQVGQTLDSMTRAGSHVSSLAESWKRRDDERRAVEAEAKSPLAVYRRATDKAAPAVR